MEKEKCKKCNGKGKHRDKSTCQSCAGKGQVSVIIATDGTKTIAVLS